MKWLLKLFPYCNVYKGSKKYSQSADRTIKNHRAYAVYFHISGVNFFLSKITSVAVERKVKWPSNESQNVKDCLQDDFQNQSNNQLNYLSSWLPKIIECFFLICTFHTKQKISMSMSFTCDVNEWGLKVKLSYICKVIAMIWTFSLLTSCTNSKNQSCFFKQMLLQSWPEMHLILAPLNTFDFGMKKASFGPSNYLIKVPEMYPLATITLLRLQSHAVTSSPLHWQPCSSPLEDTSEATQGLGSISATPPLFKCTRAVFPFLSYYLKYIRMK